MECDVQDGRDFFRGRKNFLRPRALWNVMLGTVPGGLISSDLTYVASHATFYSLSYGSQLAAGYLFFPAVFSAYLALKRTNWTLSGTMSYTLGKNNHRRNFFSHYRKFFRPSRELGVTNHGIRNTVRDPGPSPEIS